MTPIKRRTMLQLATGAALSAPALNTRANAQERQLHLGTYNSQLGKVVQQDIIPAFEADYKCRVYTIAGATLSNIAALRMTRDHPRFGVMMMDDVGVTQAKQEELIDKLDPAKIPNMARLYKRFLLEDGYGIGVSISAAGMFINPTSAATKDLNSYAQLFDPKFKRRIVLSTPKHTESVLLVMAIAAIVTGKPLQQAQYLVDQAWTKLPDLKPNVLTIFENEAGLMMVPQGEADIAGVELTKAVYPSALTGVPIGLAPMKEGFFTGINSITLAKNAPDPELANAFINRMLEPSIMQLLAEKTVSAPPISGLNFKPEIAKLLPYPESKMDDMGLVTPDWKFLIPHRSAILERYNQIFSA